MYKQIKNIHDKNRHAVLPRQPRFPAARLQDWEQGRRTPPREIICVIALMHEAVAKALHDAA